MPQDTIGVCLRVCVCVEGTTKVVNVVVACRIVCCRRLPCAFVCLICLVLRVAILFALCHTRTFRHTHTHAATHIKATLVYLLCLSLSLSHLLPYIFYSLVIAVFISQPGNKKEEKTRINTRYALVIIAQPEPHCRKLSSSQARTKVCYDLCGATLRRLSAL